MTQLDSNETPQKKGSAMSRYMKRKLWLIPLGGLGVGALGVTFTYLPPPDALLRFAIGVLGVDKL